MSNEEYYEAKKLYEKSITFFETGKSNPVFGSERRKPKTSWHLVAWVMKNSKLKKSTKLVAAQIASHYNKERKDAFPSYSGLMKGTGLSRGTIANAIKEIKASGEWKVIKSSHGDDGSTMRSNRYVPIAPKNPGTLEAWLESNPEDKSHEQ